MAKQVQIDWELFCDIYDYFADVATEPPAGELLRRLDAKVNKIINRQLFTKYKRSPSGAEREAARKEYLDHRGILRDYRSDNEYHEKEL